MNLPPLPQGLHAKHWQHDMYTAGQMLLYGNMCRNAALEEAIAICECISTKHNDTYKHKPGPNAYDPHFQGLSMGADECSEAIQELMK